MSDPTSAPGAPGRPALRIGTVEREAAVARLQVGLAEGRLELDEFDQRSAAVYAARTEADLVPVLADLPAPHPGGPAPFTVDRPLHGASHGYRHRPARNRGADARWLQYAWRAWAVAVTINLVIWALVALGSGGDVPYFWPMWVAGPWGAVLLVNTVFSRSR